MKVVHVEWIDSCAEIGWEKFTDPPTPDRTHTVGLLVSETEHYTIVANSYDPATEEWNGRISIPNVSIIECRTLCQIKT